jgi:hypothetical protein
MSTYELDNDAHVIAGLNQIRLALSVGSPGYDLADALWKQLPTPVPTKVGAVVRTETGRTYVRITTDNDFRSEWRDVETGGNVETASIGRIAEVLTEGVDL